MSKPESVIGDKLKVLTDRARLRWQESSFKIDFVIAGTQKGGTTALNEFLSKHSQICTGLIKEAHFFDDEKCFNSSQPEYSRYHFNFRHYTDQKVVGEATPAYMFNPKVAGRLFEYNSKLKLIFLLRHPVERAISHYSMMKRLGHEYLSFESALEVEKLRLAFAANNYSPDSPTMLYSYTGRGFYSYQIENFLEYFPRTQMLFIRSEELRRYHAEIMLSVFDFLEVEATFSPRSELLHQGEGQLIQKRVRDSLLEVFSPEIDRLGELTGWNLDDWRK